MSVFDFKLSVPVSSIFLFSSVVVIVVVVVVVFVVFSVDSGVLRFVRDEARCLSSNFWFAMP